MSYDFFYKIWVNESNPCCYRLSNDPQSSIDSININSYVNKNLAISLSELVQTDDDFSFK